MESPRNTTPLLNLVDQISLVKDISLNVVVKDNIYPNLLDGIKADAKKIINSGHMRRACMGKGEMVWESQSIRGDLISFITPDLCKELNLEFIPQYVRQICDVCRSIRSTACLQDEIKLNGHYSVQLGRYPGGGAGYVKHLDSGMQHHSMEGSQNGNHKSTCKSERKLTFVLYLNDKCDGGALRVYSPKLAASSIDIEPLFGRLVVFRSDIVEHEVLPCYEDRVAITVWASGEVPCQSNHKEYIPSLLPYSHTANGNNIQNGSSHGGDSKLPFSPVPFQAPPLNIPFYPPEWDAITIFVSIASYRDSELPQTLYQLFQTAKVPSRIFVGVVWQGDLPGDSHTLPLPPGPPSSQPPWAHQVRWIALPSAVAAGPCWARHLCQSLWRDEQMFLQIDSHMRFRPGWDAFLIYEWLGLKQRGVARPILTTYPLPYTLQEQKTDDVSPTVLYPSHFDEDGILRQAARLAPQTRTSSPRSHSSAHQGIHWDNSAAIGTVSPLWAAGFNFASSDVILRVPYDPQLRDVFFGEEISMAARLYTSGYDFFAPSQAVVYHLWSRDHRPTHTPNAMSRSRIKGLKRIFSLLNLKLPPHLQSLTTHDFDLDEPFAGAIPTGTQYGLGTTRSLAEFEGYAGVHLASNAIAESHRNGGRVLGSIINEVFEKRDGSKSGNRALRQAESQAVLSLVQGFLTNNA